MSLMTSNSDSAAGFVIVNGFDRSGSSAITRTLSAHPNIELVMQPFNSGFIREAMYEPLEQTEMKSKAYDFFSCLRENRIPSDLINSQWHEKHSTTLVYQPGKLHVVKTTINHFAQRWMAEYFPDIDVWGIWRAPEEIVHSLMANGFHQKWYGDALEKIIPTVEREQELSRNYLEFVPFLDSPVRRTAFLVATRSHFFFNLLKPNRVMHYKSFSRSANYLNEFTDHYGLQWMDFSQAAQFDLNIVGGWEKKKSAGDIFNRSDIAFMNDVFKPLRELISTGGYHQ